MATRAAWLRYGCFGCLGVGGLALLVVLIVSGIAALTARPQQVEERVLTPEPGGGPAGGRVVLEVREAELHVAPGEQLRVEARYDVNAFALEEQLDRGTGGERWSYRATFGRSEGSGAFAGLVSLVRGSTARIDVFLPADVPLDLVLDVRGGGAVVRLGGMWLRTAEVDLVSGAFDLNVGEPLREPMERLSIRTSRGGALLNRLGNASPRVLDVRYRVGGIDMDLGGRWLADAEIRIDGGAGGGVVHLPAGVILEGLPGGRVEPSAVLDAAPPTLTLSVSAGLGRLELSDRALSVQGAP